MKTLRAGFLAHGISVYLCCFYYPSGLSGMSGTVMNTPTKQQVLELLRSGSPAERVTFIKNLPANQFSNAAIGVAASDNPGGVVVALGASIQPYCSGSNPELGAALAAAAHERAVEIWRTVPNHGLIPTTLSGLAASHLKALTLLGRSSEVLEVTNQYIPFYEQLGENENLPALKVLRIEALINLKPLDDADSALQDLALLQDPAVGMEARRLKGWVDKYRANPTWLKSERPDGRQFIGQDMTEILTAIGSVGGEAGEILKQEIDESG